MITLSAAVVAYLAYSFNRSQIDDLMATLVCLLLQNNELTGALRTPTSQANHHSNFSPATVNAPATARNWSNVDGGLRASRNGDGEGSASATAAAAAAAVEAACISQGIGHAVGWANDGEGDGNSNNINQQNSQVPISTGARAKENDGNAVVAVELHTGTSEWLIG
jgi:hypothetical protein